MNVLLACRGSASNSFEAGETPGLGLQLRLGRVDDLRPMRLDPVR